jgi:hypothetical protein
VLFQTAMTRSDNARGAFRQQTFPHFAASQAACRGGGVGGS